MKLRLVFLFIKFFILLAGSRVAYSYNFTLKTEPISKIIHGEDNRVQTFEYEDQVVSKLGKSVALMTTKSKLHHFDEQHYIFSSPSLGEKLNLCEGQRFKDEPTLGSCSAFLIAKDLVATAGHCVTKDQNSQDEIESSCSRMRLVFNFSNKELSKNSIVTGKFKTIKKENVYKCQKVLAHKYRKTKYQLKDYAVIKLERPVTNATPLEIRKHGVPREKTKLITIGHPLGIPQKISNDAHLFPFAKEDDENFFQAFLKGVIFFTPTLIRLPETQVPLSSMKKL